MNVIKDWWVVNRNDYAGGVITFTLLPSLIMSAILWIV